MNESDLDAVVADAMERVYFTQAWLAERLETDIFLDYLDEKRIDVFDLPLAWEQHGIVV